MTKRDFSKNQLRTITRAIEVYVEDNSKILTGFEFHKIISITHDLQNLVKDWELDIR